ncbi:MAG: response regulator [Gammaproteobacteria bacterium]|nr:response regulator [Gammaproteobacteria bacterium]MBU0848455.1 response regulator [Gammaproteobacteria bacterium]MBU1267408.1 response regulator [Gammaproteobacteria bacterium]MBU1530433.1 response regulator [Gammaproteobacteria bacterium]MBU1780336.1 response regulator [Gammaproteobacteria bacterium]
MSRFILIVDDDEIFATTLARSFELKQIETRVALNKEQTLLAASQQQFTDITLDLNLGEQSGLQLITQLRKLQPQANLLVLTGYASIATTVQAIKLGADNYLAKPADSTTILRALDEDVLDSNVEVTESAEFQTMSVSRLEWEHIQRVFNEHGGNVSATARALNMHRRTLQRKLAKKPVGR